MSQDAAGAGSGADQTSAVLPADQPLPVWAPRTSPSVRETDGDRDAGEVRQRARLEALDEVAEAYVEEQRPPNTRRAYAEAWKTWERYARDIDIPPLSGTVGALVGFVRWLETAREASIATVDARLAGVVVGLRARGVPVEREATRAAWQALRAYERRLADAGIVRGRGKTPPVTLDQLRALARACPDTNAGRRDRAILLLGFAIAARRSELANLRVDDPQPDGGHGLVVRLGFTKTGPDERPVPYGVHHETCPVRAWQRWRETAGLEDGHAFRRVDRHDRVSGEGLSAQAIGSIITRCGERAGLPFRITGHSLRAGLATEARRHGADHTAVCDQGGWSYGSRAVYEYFRTVDRWSENAVGRIGL